MEMQAEWEEYKLWYKETMKKDFQEGVNMRRMSWRKEQLIAIDRNCEAQQRTERKGK